MKNESEKKCKNCLLFNSETSACGITIIKDGEYHEIATQPNDQCHWIRLEKELGFNMLDHVKTAGVWSDGKNGYIQYSDYDNNSL